MRNPSVDNLRELILKADHLAAEGDDRGASSFYLAALKAAPPPEQLPAELRSELGRAQAMCARYAAQFEAFLQERLARHPGGGKPGSRFAQSLEILFGKKQVYFQQPRNYFFPELPQIQFYERSLFPWLDSVEAATAEIRAELLEVMKEKGAFRPYVEADARRPQGDEGGMLGNLDWSAFYLVKNGETVPENAARCPRTLAVLGEAPLSYVPNRSPSVLFSLLRPGAHIPPHNGFVNTRLICHLPLIVPGKCAFRVGNEVREWVEGKALVFDDTLEHEAWNRSAETRVVLLFDVWRPELTAEERALVSAMFEAIDTHTGQKTAWET
jgi:aspartate beta-hydroxylase